MPRHARLASTRRPALSRTPTTGRSRLPDPPAQTRAKKFPLGKLAAPPALLRMLGLPLGRRRSGEHAGGAIGATHTTKWVLAAHFSRRLRAKLLDISN